MSLRYRLISFLLSAALFLSLFSALSTAGAVSVSAECAILIDARSGSVLFEKNAQRKRSMASTTKIMTAVVAIESFDTSAEVMIPREAVGIEGSSVYLCEGEVLTLEQLLYALMLSSANDAATAIAIFCAGSEAAFADMMNDTAQRLGLSDTHFENPHGLDSDSHYTTASDLARLTAYALGLPLFRRIVSTYKHEIPLAGDENARLLVNHNKLLRTYAGAIGVKTGFTKKSGRCLVSAAERNGTVLIAVTLNAPNDWNDHKSMLDYGFENYVSVELTADLYSLSVPVISGKINALDCSPSEKLWALLPRDHGSIICKMELKRFVYAPVEKGEVLGLLQYYCDGYLLGSTEILAVTEAELMPQKRSIWDKIIEFFTK